MSTANGKSLKFAALIRVSTERQEQKGESLRTQRKQIEAAVNSLGGKVADFFEGQEHSTEGHERQLLDRLLTDAQKPSRPFDAVMVADPSRWSRDNIRSETGLEVLRSAAIDFYVLGTKYDLNDPQQRLFLSLASVINGFTAKIQRQKSLLNRIERTRRGIPAVSERPYGRLWDKKTGWSVDETKREIIQEVARRFLSGESLMDVCKELGLRYQTIYKILTTRCGPTWEVSFQDPSLGINETVPMAVEPLLDEKTIKEIKRQLADRRTRFHGRPKYDYLLNGYIFCAGCGYNLTGQLAHRKNGNVFRYYRHPGSRDRPCSYIPRPYLPAVQLEEEVIGKLFDLFGSPAHLAKAVNAAAPPDTDKAQKRKQKVEADLVKVEKSKQNVIDAIADGRITKADSKEKLEDLRQRREDLESTLERIEAELVNVPTAEDIRLWVQHIESEVAPAIMLTDDDGNEYIGGNSVSTWMAMSRDDKRHLVQAVFSRRQANGEPAGVYVSRGPDGKYRHIIRGTIDFESVMQFQPHPTCKPLNTLSPLPFLLVG